MSRLFDHIDLRTSLNYAWVNRASHAFRGFAGQLAAGQLQTAIEEPGQVGTTLLP